MDPKKVGAAVAAVAAAAVVVASLADDPTMTCKGCGAGVDLVVTKPGEAVARKSEYVMPDCGAGQGPVDCRFGGPYNPDSPDVAVWRGCNAGLAKYATGTQCIAAPPVVLLGSRMEKRRGQMVEVDVLNREVKERIADIRDGGAGGK